MGPRRLRQGAAFFGLSGIPGRFIAGLEAGETLLELAQALARQGSGTSRRPVAGAAVVPVKQIPCLSRPPTDQPAASAANP